MSPWTRAYLMTVLVGYIALDERGVILVTACAFWVWYAQLVIAGLGND